MCGVDAEDEIDSLRRDINAFETLLARTTARVSGHAVSVHEKKPFSHSEMQGPAPHMSSPFQIFFLNINNSLASSTWDEEALSVPELILAQPTTRLTTGKFHLRVRVPQEIRVPVGDPSDSAQAEGVEEEDTQQQSSGGRTLLITKTVPSIILQQVRAAFPVSIDVVESATPGCQSNDGKSKVECRDS